MQNYLSQLLADLLDRHNKQPPEVDYRLLHPGFADVPDELKYVVAWENAPEQSVEDLFGLAADAFPPPEQLTDKQMEQLLDGILALWAAWRIYAVMPAQAPIAIRYRVVSDYWRNEKICYISESNIHLEFCSYQPDQCPWSSEWCSCKDL